jgi:hypothetical protein
MQGTNFCTNCGKALAPGVRFCNNCGAPTGGRGAGPTATAQGTGAAAGAAGGARRFRVRVRSPSYSRLTGEWQEVQVGSLEDWKQSRQSLLEGFRQRFGTSRLSKTRFGMAPGTQYQRWNENTWAAVIRDLVVDGEGEVLRAFQR